jgi:hypothetical protein
MIQIRAKFDSLDQFDPFSTVGPGRSFRVGRSGTLSRTFFVFWIRIIKHIKQERLVKKKEIL